MSMTRAPNAPNVPAPSSTVRPEAELESRLAAALSTAFPNIPRDQITEQRRFTVRLGHETHEFDSAAQWVKSGRADVLIFNADRRLRDVNCFRSTTYEDFSIAGDSPRRTWFHSHSIVAGGLPEMS
jgi:hypothetical protein